MCFRSYADGRGLLGAFCVKMHKKMICVCFSKIRNRRFLRDTRNDTHFLFWYPRFDTRADGLKPNHEGRHYRLSVSAGRDDFQTAQRQKKPARHAIPSHDARPRPLARPAPRLLALACSS